MLDKMTTKEACVTVMNDAVLYMLVSSCGVFALFVIAILIIWNHTNRKISELRTVIEKDGAAIMGMVGLRRAE